MAKCLACDNWHLWELNQAGRRVIQKMAQHGFGECKAASIAGQFHPRDNTCGINQFKPIEPEQMHKRLRWLGKREK